MKALKNGTKSLKHRKKQILTQNLKSIENILESWWQNKNILKLRKQVEFIATIEKLKVLQVFGNDTRGKPGTFGSKEEQQK